MALRPPSLLQAFIITISAGALALVGCLGALSAMSIETPMSRVGMVTFVVSAPVFLLGVLYLTVLIVKTIWTSLTRNR